MKVPALIDPFALKAFEEAITARTAWVKSLPKGRNPDLGEFVKLPPDENRCSVIESHPWCLAIEARGEPFAFVTPKGRDADGKVQVNFTLSYDDPPACLCAEDVRKLLPWATERASKGTNFKVALWHRDALSEFIERTNAARKLIPLEA